MEMLPFDLGSLLAVVALIFTSISWFAHQNFNSKDFEKRLTSLEEKENNHNENEKLLHHLNGKMDMIISLLQKSCRVQ